MAMTDFRMFFAPILISILFISSCAKTDALSDTTEYQLSGVSQKGPFAIGSSVTVQSLDKTLSPTGDVYLGSTSDDLGTFSLGQKIKGKFVEVVVDGYFFDEVVGTLSTGKLTLRTVSDLSEGAIKINLLTSLVGQRIKNLVSGGKEFADARSQAELEFLTAFGILRAEFPEHFDKLDISQSGSGHAVLLAVSAEFMQAAHDNASSAATVTSELSSLVSTFITDFGSDGIINSTSLLNKMRAAGAALNMGAVRSNLANRFSDLGSSVSISAFEDFVASGGDGVINKNTTGYYKGYIFTALAGITAATSCATAQVIGNYVYFAGGCGSGDGSNIVRRYDIVSNIWSTVATMTRNRAYATSVVVDSKMWVYGGMTNGSLNHRFDVFDPVANTWTESGLSGINPNLGMSSAVVIGRTIYLVGGWNAGSSVFVNKYNVDSDTWTTGVAYPGVFLGFSAVAVYGSKILVAGGYSGGSVNTFYQYDTLADAWTVLTPMKDAREGATAQVIGDKMYVFGGSADSGSRFEVYDFTASRWYSSHWSPKFFKYSTSVLSNGKIFLMGGFTILAGTVANIDMNYEFSP